MWDDDDFQVFPTRQGLSPGKGIERNLLEAVGGADGFRTRIINNPDGSTTMLRTRGGFPEFTTTSPAPKVIEEIGLVESNYLLREYWEDHALYTTMLCTLPFKYLKSITLVGNRKLVFASPPSNKLENDDYYAAESKRALDGLFTYFLFHPKRAQVTLNGQAVEIITFAPPGVTEGIEYYGYRNVIEDDAVADEAESAGRTEIDPNAPSDYLKNGNSYSRKVIKSLPTSSGALSLKDVAK